MFWKRKKKEEKASSSESLSTHPNASTLVPSSAVRSQISANSNVPLSSQVPTSTQSDGIATNTGFGSNAGFEGAAGNAIGTNNVIYNIRFGDRESTETQVERLMGSLSLSDKTEKPVSTQSRTNIPRAKAAHNDYMTQKELDTCFEGTREAVLKEIENWFIVIGTSQIFVLSGLAGIGKSTIAYTIAQRADRRRLLGASFFFSRREPERRTAEKFFTTIAFQLCVYDDGFARAIESVLATNQGEDTITKGPESQLKVLIIEPLRDLARSRTQPVVIVIDALDECERDDAQIILKALDQLVHEIPSFNVLLTTRPQPHLDGLLCSHDVFHLHNIEDVIIKNDIRRYLEFKLSTDQVNSIFPKLRKPWSATDNDIDILVQAAGKLFLVASTSVRFILDENVRNPASQMETLRSELYWNHTPLTALGDFYSIILHSVVSPGSKLVERFQKVIGAIVLIYEPLPVRVLAELIGIEEDDICGVLDSLQSVILLGPDDIPYIYHKSFSDWIVDEEHCTVKDHRIDPRDGDTWLTIRCLQIMNERLKRNILNIDGVARFMPNHEALKQEKIRKRIRKKIPPVLQYACIYWARHLDGANIDDADVTDELKIFADERFLHWVEGLGWISKITTLSVRYDGVLKFMEKTTLLQLRELLCDALRFFHKVLPSELMSALFTYHSALPFAPTESLFYRTYKRELMDNICRVQGGPTGWDAVITGQTHQQHIDYFTFFGNNEFASCSAGHIKIWDSNTGGYHRTINSDRIALADSYGIAVIKWNMIYVQLGNRVYSANTTFPTPILGIALSSNSQLAVALSDGSVVLCVIGEWEPIAEFYGFGSDGDSIHHLAFSPNGDSIAYRLARSGFALRSVISGEHITDGNYNSAMVHHLLFSPDGSQLASLFVENDDKYTLTLWDCVDGKFLGAVLDIGSELAFSADGSLIATGGWNNALKLWSRNNEDQDLYSLETSDLYSLESISCLAFSKDGILAIGSADAEIILYDVEKRSFITIISFRNPTAVAFSYDCTRLAVGNADGDLRLLDVPTIKASGQTSQGKSASVSALVFSPDCSRLVSGSEDGIIRIWNTSCASEPIAIREGHSSKITAIAFTPNGCQFASGDPDGIIKVWSSDDCDLSDTIKWPISGELTSVAIGNFALAAATKNSIALWDLQGSCIIDRLGECGSTLLSFSNQDILLASFDGDSNNVTVWDVRSLTPSATFSTGPLIDRMVFYPHAHDSYLFVHHTGGKEMRLFDVINKAPINVALFSDFVDQSIIPTWKGVPVWMYWSNNHYDIMGWFSQGDGNYTPAIVCQLPEDIDVVKAAYGSNMFALLCKNGSLLLLQSN